MVLHNYNLVVINSSAGKDSLCALWEVSRLAKEQNYPLNNLIVSHQDLGESEWPGVKELAKIQADLFGLKIYYSKRRNKKGQEETLLEYVRRRGKWPSSSQRYCTSDFKRGPGARVVTALTKNFKTSKILYVFGFRKEESPSRSKKKELEINRQLTTKKRKVYNWLPIHTWTEEKVWETIKSNKLPYHKAYDLGMPRLSCCFCIFSPFDALVLAGKENPELLQHYVDTEEKIGHTFKNGSSIKSVKEAIDSDYEPKKIKNWRM